MADSPTDKVKEKVVDAATSDDEGLIAPLKKAAVTAAVAALTPVVKNAAEGAANKLPEMLENAGGPEGIANLAKDKLGEAGGMGGVAKLVTDQIGGGGGGIVSSALGAVTGGALGGGDDDSEASKPPDGAGSGRRMPIQQAVDVAAPLSVVYNQFTQFEEWTKFMHRAESASQEDEGHVNFKTKMWAVSRQWESEITDQRPDERIAWKTTSGPNLAGVATFHELAPRLTRVEVNVDFAPQGFFEKIGRGWRFAKRAIRGDLHRFKAYVEMHEEETGEWRGYIRDGEPIEEQDYYGEETAAGAEGELVDEDGHPIAFDEEGNLVAVDEEGNPVAAAEEEPAAEEDVEEEPVAEEEPEEDEELEDESGPVAEEELEDEDAEEELEDEAVASGDRGGARSSGRRARSSSRDGASATTKSRSRGGSSSSKGGKSGGRSRSSGGSRSSSGKGASGKSSGRSRARAASGS